MKITLTVSRDIGREAKKRGIRIAEVRKSLRNGVPVSLVMDRQP
jgi:hypothetical protein